MDELVYARLGWHKGGDAPSVAQHRDGVADGEDFLEAVGDVDDRHAVPPQHPDAFEEPTDLRARERGGWLVHDENTRALRERVGDLDHLLMRYAKRMDERARVEIHAEHLEQTPRLRMHTPAIDGAGNAAAKLAAEKDVLRDAEVGNEREFLEDDRNPEPARVGRRVDADGPALDPHFAPVRMVRAAQDLDERGLPCAVLPEQDVHLSGVHRQRYVLERADSRERLGDSTHLENRRHDEENYTESSHSGTATPCPFSAL